MMGCVKFKQSIRRSFSGITTILLVLVIMSLISIVAFSMTEIYLKQIKNARSDIQSIQAYQAADTGAEDALYSIPNTGGVNSACVAPNKCSLTSASCPGGSAYYQYKIISTTTVQIIGSCGSTHRAIEINQ